VLEKLACTCCHRLLVQKVLKIVGPLWREYSTPTALLGPGIDGCCPCSNDNCDCNLICCGYQSKHNVAPAVQPATQPAMHSVSVVRRYQ